MYMLIMISYVLNFVQYIGGGTIVTKENIVYDLTKINFYCKYAQNYANTRKIKKSKNI